MAEILGRAKDEPFSSSEAESSSHDEFPRGGETPHFSTEWAYRLAVTKLTAKLKAARERLRGEKEASRSAGVRAEQVGRSGAGKGWGIL